MLNDVNTIIDYLRESLPKDMLKALARVMMPPITEQIKKYWLDSAVPASLDDMLEFQKVLALVQDFARRLKHTHWPGWEAYENWVVQAPKIWLVKRREASLDNLRRQLARGKGFIMIITYSNTVLYS